VLSAGREIDYLKVWSTFVVDQDRDRELPAYPALVFSEVSFIPSLDSRKQFVRVISR
jgi:hypothetical protein